MLFPFTDTYHKIEVFGLMISLEKQLKKKKSANDMERISW